jgi:molecular chaperone DnaK (HSP70)
MTTVTPSQASADFIIAIDFGTTFTGVAYFYSGATSSIPKDERDALQIAEKVSVVKTWPNANSQYMEKIPTIISYHSTPPTWGGSVKPQHDLQVAHFKLGLEPSVSRHYAIDAEDEEGVMYYGTHLDLPEKRAVDFTTDYLQCIRHFLQDRFFPTQFGAQFLRNQKISYVVTVPAIWSDGAKALTRDAASKAFDITTDELILVPEPEAAALFCATTCNEVDLTDGDQFLICDAGGGTVVCQHLRASKFRI